MDSLAIGIVGLGVIGTRVAEIAVSRGHQILWTVDPSPKPLPTGAAGARSAARLGLLDPDGDVAVIATASRLADVFDDVASVVRSGLNVVSSAEGLAYPWRTEPGAAAELDALARRHGVSILGTGFNPGFLMDLLPAALSALLPDVRRVELTRSVEMSPYGQLVHRFGLGASPVEFEARRVRGELAGHIGFEESIACLAAALDFEVEAIEVEAPEIVALADAPLPGSGITIDPGQVAVVGQVAGGRVDGREAISCRARFGFFGDVEGRSDVVRLESAAGRSLEFSARPPALSAESTACIVANSLRATVEAAPGLLSPTDMSAGAIAARGH